MVILVPKNNNDVNYIPIFKIPISLHKNLDKGGKLKQWIQFKEKSSLPLCQKKEV